MPNDDIEQLRLALLHRVFLHVLDGELTTTVLQDPGFILDVGTGTGEWAMRMAELYPRCDVVGTDISAIAETRSVPMNVFFEIEDAEDWDRPPDHFDLIHFRGMNGAFRDWKAIYESVYYSLRPGGWIEVQDFDNAAAFDKFFKQFDADSPIHELFRDVEIAADKSGRSRAMDYLDPALLVAAGFVDFRVMEYSIPICFTEKSVGNIWLVSCLDALEATCLRLLTEQMGWDPDKCKAACEQAARELATLAKKPEKAKGLVIKIRVVAARKPATPPATNGTKQQEKAQPNGSSAVETNA